MVELLIFELAVQLLTRGWSSPVVVVVVALTQLHLEAMLVHQVLVAMDYLPWQVGCTLLAVEVQPKLLVALADHVVQVVLPMDQVELQVHLAKVALLVMQPEDVAVEAVAVAVITAVVVAEWNAAPDQVVAVQAGLIHYS